MSGVRVLRAYAPELVLVAQRTPFSVEHLASLAAQLDRRLKDMGWGEETIDAILPSTLEAASRLAALLNEQPAIKHMESFARILADV